MSWEVCHHDVCHYVVGGMPSWCLSLCRGRCTSFHDNLLFEAWIVNLLFWRISLMPSTDLVSVFLFWILGFHAWTIILYIEMRIWQLSNIHRCLDMRAGVIIIYIHSLMVCGIQNGSDKMVWSKCFAEKMLLDKVVRKMVIFNIFGPKWYGQNGTDKMLCWQNVIDKVVWENG